MRSGAAVGVSRVVQSCRCHAMLPQDQRSIKMWCMMHLNNSRKTHMCFVMPPITPPAEICSHIEPHSAIRRSNQHPRQCDTVMLRWEMCCNIIICIKIWNHLWLTLIMFDSRIICGGQNTTPATSKSSSILMPATAAYHRHLSLFYTTINRLNKWITGIKCIN